MVTDKIIVKDSWFSKWSWFLGGGLLLAVCPFALAWFSNSFTGMAGWTWFLSVILLAGCILVGGWWLIQQEHPPRWLFGLLVGAALLRLVMGVIWYVGLPTGGYSSPAEEKGYVMADAYKRDQAAWKLAQKERPLWQSISTIRSYRKADQYGGLLFLSAFIYRYLGGETHHPLQMVVITAAFSALAVLFSWAFARRAWGDTVAGITAWGLALYPEAVLLGSSQMREAFLITLITATFYGLLRYFHQRTWKNLLWILAPLCLTLPFSPPVTAILTILLVVQTLFMRDGSIFRQRTLWLLLAGLAILACVGIWLAWKRLAPPGISNPLDLISWWIQQAISLQARQSRLDSGWTQKLFRDVPSWISLTILVIYGVVRPLLPAAIIDFTSVPIWHGIAIWRALGWTLLLPFLLYAPVMLFRKPAGQDKRALSIATGTSVVIWVSIILSSMRAGADMWDNPRYRVMFAGLQVALAAWVWVCYRTSHDPWLKKALIAMGIILVWFVPWYMERYIELVWPVRDFIKTLGLGVFSVILYFLWSWLKASD